MAGNRNQNNNNKHSDFWTHYLLLIKHSHLKAPSSVVMGTSSGFRKPVLNSGSRRRRRVPSVPHYQPVGFFSPLYRQSSCHVWVPLSWARSSPDPPSRAAPLSRPSQPPTKASPWRKVSHRPKHIRFHGMGDEGQGRPTTALLTPGIPGLGKKRPRGSGVELSGLARWEPATQRLWTSFPGRSRAHDRKCSEPIKCGGGPAGPF